MTTSATCLQLIAMDTRVISSLALFLTSLHLTGCASPAGDFAVNHAIPVAYENLDCDQLSAESQRLVNRMNGGVDGNAQATAAPPKKESSLKRIAKALAEPAAFAIAASKGVDGQLWQARSAYDQVQAIAARKQCPAPAAQPSVEASNPGKPNH